MKSWSHKTIPLCAVRSMEPHRTPCDPMTSCTLYHTKAEDQATSLNLSQWDNYNAYSVKNIPGTFFVILSHLECALQMIWMEQIKWRHWSDWTAIVWCGHNSSTEPELLMHVNVRWCMYAWYIFFTFSWMCFMCNEKMYWLLQIKMGGFSINFMLI